VRARSCGNSTSGPAVVDACPANEFATVAEAEAAAAAAAAAAAVVFMNAFIFFGPAEALEVSVVEADADVFPRLLHKNELLDI
jgi:hypothetical protein